MNYLLYEESRPSEIREMLAESPVAYVPFGALEWHGEHGPLGLDGIKAHELCRLTAERTGGVVFPTVFWGAFDTVPFPFTFHFKKSGLKALVRSMLSQLEDWGFKVIVLLTGHYPMSQQKLLRRECRRFSRNSGRALAIGIPEQALATDIGYYGDHAGMWETSIMMAMRPELMDLSAMPAGLPTLDRLEKYCVMGQDPISKATVEKGQKAIEHIVEKLSQIVDKTSRNMNNSAIEEAYHEYDRGLNIFSPKVRVLIREVLDVHSLSELVRYGRWFITNL